MKTTFFSIGLILISFNSIFSQVGIGNTNPDPSSALEIVSTSKGVLIPRVSIANVSSQLPIVTLPKESLLVYNTNIATIGGQGKGFYYWNGLKWISLISSTSVVTLITPHNTLDKAYDEGPNPGSGRIITADNGYVHISGADGLRVTGGINSGNLIGTANGVQMFFYPRKAAFRSGSGSYTDLNLGRYSVAMGLNNSATGQSSLALVNGSSATAESAVAIGNGASALQQDDMALGQSALANGKSATAIGESAEATGISSIAIGSAAHSIGDNSTALGASCQAEALNSTAIGSGSLALGNNSLAIGNGVRADSFSEFALGTNNTNGGGNPTLWVATDRLFSIGNGELLPSNAMVVLKNGNTGIGIDAPLQKLEVNGNVKATSFISATTTYPDYVFQKYYNGFSTIKSDYKMLTIDKAEEYVKKNGHLNGVKSYNEVKNNDLNVNLTEMSIKNLEKIEELFLYITQLNNENKKLRNEIEILKNK